LPSPWPHASTPTSCAGRPPREAAATIRSQGAGPRNSFRRPQSIRSRRPSRSDNGTEALARPRSGYPCPFAAGLVRGQRTTRLSTSLRLLQSAQFAWTDRALAAVVLNAGCAQPGQSMLVDRTLPGQELVHGQLIAIAGLLDAEEAAAHGRYDLR